MYDRTEDGPAPKVEPPKPPKPVVGSLPLLACDLKGFLLIFVA